MLGISQKRLYLCSRNDAKGISEYEINNKDIYFIKERNL